MTKHQKESVMINAFSVKKIKELEDNGQKKKDSKDPKIIAKLGENDRNSSSI